MSPKYLLQFFGENAVRRLSFRHLAFEKFPEKIHLLQESYVCHNRHNKKQYTHNVLRQESFNNSVLGPGLKSSCSGLVK